MADRLSDAELVAEVTRRIRRGYAEITHGPPMDKLRNGQEWADSNAERNRDWFMGCTDAAVLEVLEEGFDEGKDFMRVPPDHDLVKGQPVGASFVMRYDTAIQVASHHIAKLTPDMVADKLAIQREGFRGVTLGLNFVGPTGRVYRGKKSRVPDVLDVVTIDSVIIVTKLRGSRAALGRVLTAILYYPTHRPVIYVYEHADRHDRGFEAVCSSYGVAVEYDTTGYD